MKFTARSTQKDLFGEGKHKVVIASIAETKSKKSELYVDQTPQLEVKFETETGFITKWFNLMGYKKNPDSTYTVNPKTKKRIEDAENTASAIAIFERLAIHAGMAQGEEFEIADLVGLEVGIKVRTGDNGKLEVQYTMPADRVTAPAETETEA